MQSSQAPSCYIIYTENVLANIIISVLLPCPHFVLFLLEVIYFVNDPNKIPELYKCLKEVHSPLFNNSTLENLF